MAYPTFNAPTPVVRTGSAVERFGVSALRAVQPDALRVASAQRAQLMQRRAHTQTPSAKPRVYQGPRAVVMVPQMPRRGSAPVVGVMQGSRIPLRRVQVTLGDDGELYDELSGLSLKKLAKGAVKVVKRAALPAAVVAGAAGMATGVLPGGALVAKLGAPVVGAAKRLVSGGAPRTQPTPSSDPLVNIRPIVPQISGGGGDPTSSVAIAPLTPETQKQKRSLLSRIAKGAKSVAGAPIRAVKAVVKSKPVRAVTKGNTGELLAKAAGAAAGILNPTGAITGAVIEEGVNQVKKRRRNPRNIAEANATVMEATQATQNAVALQDAIDQRVQRGEISAADGERMKRDVARKGKAAAKKADEVARDMAEVVEAAAQEAQQLAHAGTAAAMYKDATSAEGGVVDRISGVAEEIMRRVGAAAQVVENAAHAAQVARENAGAAVEAAGAIFDPEKAAQLKADSEKILGMPPMVALAVGVGAAVMLSRRGR